VVEADEYAGNFDPYRPDLVVLLNAEWDHPDVFADEQAVLAAFDAWIRRAPDATVVANARDRGVRAIVDRLSRRPGQVVEAGELPAQFVVGLPGPANLDNARCTYAAGLALEVPLEAIRESLAEYAGVGRRMELKGDVGGVVVLDDYGHHPTAIAKTMQAARERYPNRRLWAVYEPLTFHRTAAMLDQFADVLAGADAVAIADIWAGRDTDTTVTSSAALAEAVNRRGQTYADAPGSVEATAEYLAGHVKSGDVVLVMGGGRSYVIAQQLVEALKAGTGS
jgi:UDP-N-acetylmuramate--alanine ligase